VFKFTVPLSVLAKRLRALRPGGFSLVELAIVLLIVSLVVGGLLAPLSAQVDLRKASDTRKSLQEIREALLGFAAVNGRLPCPAIPTTPSDNPRAGHEGDGQVPLVLPGGVCPNPRAPGVSGVPGVLPWATLGLNETDGWGRRYSYQVEATFSQALGMPSPPPCASVSPAAAFVLCSPSTLRVRSSADGGVIAGNVPAVVISHGKNGHGAFTPDGKRLPIGTGADADLDEEDNQLASTNPGWVFLNNDFVSKTPTPTFDDEVVWISQGVLFSRMIGVGKLP